MDTPRLPAQGRRADAQDEHHQHVKDQQRGRQRLAHETPAMWRIRKAPKPISRMNAAARSRDRNSACVSFVRCGPLPATPSRRGQQTFARSLALRRGVQDRLLVERGRLYRQASAVHWRAPPAAAQFPCSSYAAERGLHSFNVSMSCRPAPVQSTPATCTIVAARRPRPDHPVIASVSQVRCLSVAQRHLGIMCLGEGASTGARNLRWIQKVG